MQGGGRMNDSIGKKAESISGENETQDPENDRGMSFHFLRNPLPEPRKKAHVKMDFDLELTDETDEFDVEIDDDDDFDM